MATGDSSGDGLIDRGIGHAETAIYVVISVILCAGAALLLGEAIYTLFDGLSDSIKTAATDALDVLLLTFIFVELLNAVRTTLRESRLVAEPFLLVGIIAAIKEIVLISGTEDPRGNAFEESMIEIGVLGGLALVLALAAFLLRRKEREPEEGDA
jgi:uncharacterized membrane protein (DUF373 family)